MRGRLQFLRKGRFWLNYAFILAVTSWVPLLTQTATMTGSDGAVLKRTTIEVRAYQSWQALFTHGPGAGQGMAVAMHMGLCFVVAAFIWFLMFKPAAQNHPAAVSEPPHDENAPVSGDAPVPQASRLPLSHDDHASSSEHARHE